MAEFEIQAMSGEEVSRWDFDMLRGQFEKALEKYKNVVYSDEKSAKNAKSEINKVKKLIEDKRKEYKKQCLAPYEAVESELKSLTSMLDEQIKSIDDSVKAFELNRVTEKEAMIKDMFAKRAAPLGEYSARLYTKLFNPKWLNVTTSKNTIEQEIILLVNTAAEEIAKIRSLQSPYAETLLDEYAEKATLAETLARNDELIGINERAGISAAAENIAVKRNVVTDENGVLMRIFADKDQLDRIMDFMDAIGVRFEVEQ